MLRWRTLWATSRAMFVLSLWPSEMGAQAAVAINKYFLRREGFCD
ncbi:hypothetical protein [Bradyrhizobium roseum]|nr:hypothetical protein [Bradyrhizobium roseus]WKA30663.1 hypothetical protein QUH67_11040 [Bradyrhizobium roseus]